MQPELSTYRQSEWNTVCQVQGKKFGKKISATSEIIKYDRMKDDFNCTDKETEV